MSSGVTKGKDVCERSGNNRQSASASGFPEISLYRYDRTEMSSGSLGPTFFAKNAFECSGSGCGPDSRACEQLGFVLERLTPDLMSYIGNEQHRLGLWVCTSYQHTFRVMVSASDTFVGQAVPCGICST